MITNRLPHFSFRIALVGLVAVSLLLQAVNAAFPQTDQICASGLSAIMETQLEQAELIRGLQNDYDRATKDPVSGRRTSASVKLYISCIATTIQADLAQPDQLANGTARHSLLARIGFLGNQVDWESPSADFKSFLKHTSRTLKSAQRRDEQLIVALDTALSFEKDEFRSFLVAPPLVEIDPDLLYSVYIKRKGAALEAAISEGIYADGPMQGVLHDLQAIAWEEQFFLLEGSDHEKRAEIMRKALSEYNVVLTLLDEAIKTPGKSLFGGANPRHLLNDLRYRYALLLLVGKKVEEAIGILNLIIKEANTWDTGIVIDHIYIDRFLRRPYPIRLSDDGGVSQLANDKDQVNRFFNPYQLAILTCGILDFFEDEGLYEQAVGRLKEGGFQDYRLYLVSGTELAKMEETLENLSSKLKDATDEIRKFIVTAGNPLRSALRPATSACLKQEAGSLPNVFESPDFTLRGNWQSWKDFSGEDERTLGIYFGGYLTYDESVRIAPLLKKHLNLPAMPFPARPLLEG